MKKITLLFICFCMIAIGNSYAGLIKLPLVTVQDSINADTHWTRENQYLLKGWVYVTAGHTLTIDAGVVVFGDTATGGTLIVERGAKIYCNGKVDSPIVFTSPKAPGSRDYGDWGGLVLLGKAPNAWATGDALMEGGPRSHYGGTDPTDNSGKLSYVRIEFAGIPFSPNNEINGLSLYSVGTGTVIDHIQVSYSGDDGIEWFGGTVNAKYLFCYRSWDDDFDTDLGFNGRVQYGVVMRDPDLADLSGSKAFESDSYQSGTITGLAGDTSHVTKCVFSNCTIIGPVKGNPGYTGASPNYVAGVHIRRGSSLSLVNSLVVGWPVGVLIDESSSGFGSTVANICSNSLQFRNNVIAGTSNLAGWNKNIVFVSNGARSLTVTTADADTATTTNWSSLTCGYVGPYTWVSQSSFSNTFYPTEANGTKLKSPWDLDKPNFIGTSVSPICYNSKALPSYIPSGTFPGNVYPFNPANAINTDTSAMFTHYNAPDLPPSYDLPSKAADSYFDRVNYVGAFHCGDNWLTQAWVEIDCQHMDYTQWKPDAVAQVTPTVVEASVSPNPANGVAYLTVDVDNHAKVYAALLDINGRFVKNIFRGSYNAGQKIEINLSDVATGEYMVKVATINGSKTIKLIVTK